MDSYISSHRKTAIFLGPLSQNKENTEPIGLCILETIQIL